MLSLGRAKYHLFTLFDGCRQAGVAVTLHWFRFRFGRKLGIPEPAQWNARPRQVRHNLAVRLHGSSDTDVFCQIFLHEEYSSLRSLQNVSSILDLGANVGFASACLLSYFPQSRILAVEPDVRNVNMCRTNLQPYGERAQVLHGAVWSENTKLCLSHDSFGDGREWATQVLPPREGTPGEVEAWDVATLIDKAGFACVDVLKIDIEGAERVVFGGSSKTWLHRVRNLCIELHGDKCREVFFDALTGFDYELDRSEELTICRNIRLKQ